MSARPTVSILSAQNGVTTSTALPEVFKTPIRQDIVLAVHTNMAKNNRQAYAVAENAGHQHSAESWGTGRAVARIPRVSGGGTHRAGQGAFGNMCRGGRMFAPTKVWRKWHRKTNLNQKRYATASALAASAVPALVMARGHKIEQISEVPLVISNEIEKISKTKAAIELLKAINAYSDIEKVIESRKIRAGKGKARNRRHVQRKGPLIVYGADEGITKAFRNIPGVDLAEVTRLNLLELAPGSHLGRFIIWTQGAFEKLDSLYGTHATPSELKKGFVLPHSKVTNTDITRVINSDEIQSVLRAAGSKTQTRAPIKKNPLRNDQVLVRMNPYAQYVKRVATSKAAREKTVESKRTTTAKKNASKRNVAFVKTMLAV